MALRDRLRRWWSPAQWEDDHPAERKQRDQRKKNHSAAEMGKLIDDMIGPSGHGHTDYERDFKPR